MTSQSQDELKQAVARYVVDNYVKSGLKLGLGSGSTAELFVAEVGKRFQAGQLNRLTCVATSEKVQQLAVSFGLNVVDLDEIDVLDITIDGADEIDAKSFNVVKGRGAALLREKLVAAASRLEIIIADESKLVKNLGEKMPVPVEIISFGWSHTARRLQDLGAAPILRAAKPGGDAIIEPFITDNGNYILDCQFGVMEYPAIIAEQLKSVVGVVEHGLFIGIAGRVVIAGAQGVYELPLPQ